jgi:hypothetical protein
MFSCLHPFFEPATSFLPSLQIEKGATAPFMESE